MERGTASEQQGRRLEVHHQENLVDYTTDNQVIKYEDANVLGRETYATKAYDLMIKGAEKIAKYNETETNSVVPVPKHPWSMIPEYLEKALPNSSAAFAADQNGGALTGDTNAQKGHRDRIKNMAQNIQPTAITGTPAGIKAAKKKFFENILQCVLLAGTPALQDFSEAFRDFYPYGGRVIPIDIKQQENFINALTLPAYESGQVNKDNIKKKQTQVATINDYLTSTKMFNDNVVTNVGLYKVIKNYKDPKGKLRNDGFEIDFPLNFKTGWPQTNYRNKNPIAVFEGGGHKDLIKGSRPDYVKLSSIDIDFKGGTLATAKSDVECKIVFELADISYIEQSYQYYISLDGEDILYQFSFLDLISYTNKNNTGTGFGSSLRKQYHPDYNRLLLKANIKHIPKKGKKSVANYKAINEMLEQVPLVLDLALVDHTIDKSDTNNSAKVTIHYRGWVDSMLSDPSQDALASNRTFFNRIFREIATRKLINSGCNYEQIKNFYNSTAAEAKANISGFMADIISRLDARNKLFKLYMKSSAITRALSADE